MPSTSAGAAFERTPVRLSAAQKRDLVGQAVAAVITTALIAAPLVVPRETDAHRATPAQSAAAPIVARAVVAAPQVVADAPAAMLDTLAAAPATTGIKHRPRTVSTSPPVQAAPATLMAAPNTVTDKGDTPRRPLVHRLAGLLTGDGSHPVRPFPTLPPGRE